MSTVPKYAIQLGKASGMATILKSQTSQYLQASLCKQRRQDQWNVPPTLYDCDGSSDFYVWWKPGCNNSVASRRSAFSSNDKTHHGVNTDNSVRSACCRHLSTIECPVFVRSWRAALLGSDHRCSFFSFRV